MIGEQELHSLISPPACLTSIGRGDKANSREMQAGDKASGAISEHLAHGDRDQARSNVAQDKLP
jgi:hypothetical protein